MKISFDFDNTLEFDDIQEFAETLKEEHELWIVTTRYENPKDYITKENFNEEDIKSIHKPIFEAAERLSIPPSRIVFTNMAPKANTLKKHGIQIHFDDNELERKIILEKNYLISFVDVLRGDWANKFREEMYKCEFLPLYQISEKNGHLVEQRENRVPWAICKNYQFVAHSWHWLFFRYHKLCRAKLRYFEEKRSIFRYAGGDLIVGDSSQEKSQLIPTTTTFWGPTGNSVNISELTQIKSIGEFHELTKWLEGGAK